MEIADRRGEAAEHSTRDALLLLMSFRLDCPNCGPRDVNEFAYAGETTVRPGTAPSRRELSSYLYFRRNVAGIQREWWHHRLGCRVWFLADRDTRTNEVVAVLAEAKAKATI
jgi:heterotetrameric sarcosine oxidase delta subunit